ncbi:uncharacterized protein LOC101240168 isoform X3 [Hydra vulgaris]|uniref:Uncharacterized protein LOC101240168 isoform X3 n=2 Tax=Hydra vulgaris TaxID=6087 RepID=A0ABM4D0D0_HYDVU
MLLIQSLLCVFIVTQAMPHEKTCKNHFGKNQKQLFRFTGIVENGIAGTTNNVTKIKITADVTISNWNLCKFYLQLSKVTFHQSLGESESEKFEPLPAYDLANRLTKYPLLFYMNEGHVVKVQPSVESTQPDVLNIQRGILSMLQVKNVNDIGNVNDVSGSCKTIYSILNHKKSVPDENILLIKKVKELQTCNHEITHSNIIGNPYSFSGGMKNFNERVNFEQSQSSILESNSHCFYKMDLKNQAQLIDIQCEENFLVKAFSSDYKAGAYVKSRSSMIMVSEQKIFSWVDVYTNFYVASIKYDHNHQHTPPKVPSVVKVSNLLNTLSKEHFSESKFDTAEKFIDFVASLRQLTSNDIFSILQSVELDKPSVRSFLLDGLAQCGSHECLSILFDAIQKNVQLQKEAHRFMPYIAFIKEPSPEIIRLLMGIHQQTKNPSMLLALTTLVHKLCIHRAGECSMSGDIGKVVEDVEYYLLRLLGNNCQVTNSAVLSDIYFALKGIGNIGRSVKALPLIMDCIRNAKHSNVSVAAIQSMRKMKIPDAVIENLREILADKNEDFEKRAEIFLQLMKNPSHEDIILAIDLANDQEESGQVKSFITSFLKGAASNEDPTKQKLRNLFKQTVEKYPLIDFNPSAYQYSKFIQKSANIFQTSAAIDAMILYHPESFVPRALRLNFTTHMLGFSVNALEINARLDGLESIMQKYFADNDYSDSYFGKAFKLPNMELKQKKRRDVKSSYFEELDNKVNMRKPVPHTSIDLKIFNNDIHTFGNEDIPFLNGQWDDLNIIKEMYELTKGKQSTFKQNMILLEASHSVPTILGLPLKIGVNGSSIVSFDLKAKLSTQNILFGTKSATIDVYLNPSVSTHVSAKLNIECIGVGEIGTSFKMNMHAAKKISAKADYAEGKELKIDFDAENDVNDLFNVSYNMFHVLTGKEEKMKGIEKRSSIDICLDDIVNSTEIFGSDTCIILSFPNGYYNQSMPYFPLTGPVQLGVINYPKDALLKKYSLHLIKRDNLYDLTLSTPGSSIKRNYFISLGLKSSQDHGLVALSFGENRKGITLKYKFNNITNEFETSIDCNFTTTPFSLFMQYYNQSDQFTLNKAIGEVINFNFGDYYMKHSSFYNTNYDYWALGTKTEYSPGKVIAGNLKIQYNPQVLTFELSHPTTSSLVSGYFSPSFPYLVGELNITHGNSIDIKGSGRIDIANYKVEGTVNAQPFNQHITAVGVWVPEDKVITLDAKVNENPVSWKANLTTIDGLNYASSLLQISKTVLKNNFSWNSKVFNSDLYVAEKKLFQVASNIEKYSDGINLFVSFYLKDSLSKFNLKFKNSSSLQEVSVDGVFRNKTYGYSLSSHVEEFSNRLNLNVLSKVGVFEEFISLNHSRNQYFSTTVLKIVDHAYISLKKNKQKLECAGQLYGLNLLLVKDLMEHHEKASITMSYTNSQTFKQVFNSTLSYQTSLNNNLDENIFLSIQTDYLNYNGTYEFYNNASSLSLHLFNRTRFTEEDLLDIQSDDAISLPSYEVVTFWWQDSALKKIELKTQPIGIFSIEFSLNDYIVKTKQNDTSYFEPLFVFNIQQDNSIYFKIMKENLFLNNLFLLYENDIENVKIIISTIFGQFAEQVLNKLDISKEKKMIMLDNLKSSAFMYFTNLECNGEDVYKKFINHRLTEDEITDFILKLIYISNSSETSKSVKNVQLASTKNSTINMFYSMAWLLLNESSGSSFDREFVSHAKNFIDIIHSSFNSDFMKPSNQQKFDQLTQHFSSDMKTKFSLAVQNIVEFLKSWKYWPDGTFDENLINFFEELSNNKTIKVLILDWEKQFINFFLKQSKVPDEISNSIALFTDDLDYVKLVSNVLKYILYNMNVTENVEIHLNEILSSATLDQVLYKFCSIVTLHGNLNEDNSFFLEYLKNQNSTMFFEKSKMAMSRYKIPKDFLDEVFSFLEKKQPLEQYKDILKLATTSYSSKIFMNAIDRANSSLLLKFLSLLLKEENEYLQTMKILVSNETQAIQKVKNVYKMFLKSEYVSQNGIQDFKQLNDFLSEIFFEDQNISNKLKLLGLDYHNKLKILLKERVSSNWYNRIIGFINKVEKHLIDVDVQKLSINATLEILKFVEQVHQDASLFVGNKLGNYLYEDIVSLSKGLLSRTIFNGEDALSILTRLSIDLNEKLLFLLRLLKQFSETELKHFTQNFVKNNQIDYYKVYQSIWDKKFSSKDNIKHVSGLLNGLEQYLSDESIKWTGNYSLINTLSNLIFVIQSVNYSDINMFIDSYKQIDLNSLNNSTIDAYISMLLHIMGQVEINNKSIDLIIYEYIPKLMQFSKTSSDYLDLFLSKYIRLLENGKHSISNGFQYLKDNLKNQKQNKFIKFLIEVFVPGIDGLLALIEEYNPEFLSFFDDHDHACLDLLKKLETNETFQYNTLVQFPVINYVSGKSDFNTTACNIRKHLGIIIRLKKDDMFLDKVLNQVDNIVLKLFDEAKTEALVSQKTGVGLFTAFRNMNFKSKLMLHNITFNIILPLLSSLKYFEAYRFHQQYLSLEKQDFLKIIESYFFTRFQHFTMIPVDKFLNENIPVAIKSSKNHLKHATLITMKNIDKMKAQFSNQLFVVNPISYVKNIPKNIFDQLSKNIRKNRTMHTHRLHILEGKIRNTHQILINKMAKKADLVQEIIEKLQNSSKKLIFETFPVISKDNVLLEKLINNSENNIVNVNLKQKLIILSNISRNLRSQKFEAVYFFDVKSNLTKKFDLFMKDIKDRFIDADNLHLIQKSFKYLIMDFKQFTNQLIYPQVAYIVTYLDGNICQFKLNLSQIYKENNDSYLFKWQKSYDAVQTEIYKEYKKLRGLHLTAERNNINKEFLKFGAIHKLLEVQIEPFIQNYIGKIDNIIKIQSEKVHFYYNVLYPYISQRPELIIEAGLKIYQRQLMHIALIVNKAIAIKPLSQFEAYTGKLFQVAFGKKKTTIFAPLPRTAYLFTKSLITFDGKAIFFPTDFQSKKCVFLLARDFLWKRFSIYIRANIFIVDFNNSSVQIEMDTRKVHVYGTDHTIDLPVQINFMSVTRLPNLVKIKHAFGLVIYCRLDVFSCNITVSGYYHNKTLGLFGTNNVDHSDDLRTPNGKLALDLLEFLNAFEMSKKCFISDPSQIFSNQIAKIRAEKEPKCIDVFNQISQDNFMVKTAFLLACSLEDICLVASSFMNRPSEDSKHMLSFPPICEICRDSIKKKRYDQLNHTTINVHVTLLIKLVPEIEKGLKKLIVLAPRLQRELGSKYRLQFSVIGFGGRGLREEPHIQTGNGEINMDAIKVEKALHNLNFIGEQNNKRLGLKALKFASELEPEFQSLLDPTKIFILFDDDILYTNSLLEIMEVHRSMTKRGIILNVANNYRLERDVIGKDSFGMRYLNRLPKGEKHSSVQFPPPDDYMPLIKQSQGAVFTLKAFVSNLPIWEKSWYIALSSALQLQIARDRKLCKECDCRFCKNVKNEECEFDL